MIKLVLIATLLLCFACGGYERNEEDKMVAAVIAWGAKFDIEFEERYVDCVPSLGKCTAATFWSFYSLQCDNYGCVGSL